MKSLATIAIALLLTAAPAAAQTADGQFTVSFDGSTLEVNVELQGNPVHNLAQTTLRFTYNEAGLSYATSPVDVTDYTFPTYNATALYNSFVTNNLTPGGREVSVNVDLAFGAGLPLPSAWTNVVTLYFDILNPVEMSNLQWTLREVFKTPGAPADQYSVGTFADLNIPLDASLPVAVSAFDAAVDGRDVLLSWEAESSDDDAGAFSIQSAYGDGNWQSLGTLDQMGSGKQSYSYRAATLAPGTHRFRLAMIALDGRQTYSDEIEVVVSISDQFELGSIFPNPTSDSGTMTLTVAESQYVRVELYNLLGQQVRTAFSGDVRADEPVALKLGGFDLPAGQYLVRVQGTEFVGTRSFSIVR